MSGEFLVFHGRSFALAFNMACIVGGMGITPIGFHSLESGRPDTIGVPAWKRTTEILAGHSRFQDDRKYHRRGRSRANTTYCTTDKQAEPEV